MNLDALQAALIDLLDGSSPHEIVATTGLSEERAQEIWDIYTEATKDYNNYNSASKVKPNVSGQRNRPAARLTEAEG